MALNANAQVYAYDSWGNYPHDYKSKIQEAKVIIRWQIRNESAIKFLQLIRLRMGRSLRALGLVEMTHSNQASILITIVAPLVHHRNN